MIGAESGTPTSAPFPMEGSLPPGLDGTLFRVGPSGADTGGEAGADQLPGALHAVELREGKAVSYVCRRSRADAGVFWHAGSLLALPEAGLPAQYSRLLDPEEFAGRLTAPVASHTHRLAADGARVLFAVDDGAGRDAVPAEEGVYFRMGEWDAKGALHSEQSVSLERATWQHDIGVTAAHVVFIESPTTRLRPPVEDPDIGPDEVHGGDGDGRTRNRHDPRVPFGWVPGAEGWVGVVPRDGNGTSVKWYRVDPCLVTHVLGAWEEDEPGAANALVLYVCRYDAPEPGQPVDPDASVVAAGVGLSAIGGSLPVLERWRLSGERLERTVMDDRHVEYPRADPCCEGEAFRFGYAVELDWGEADRRRSGGPASTGDVVTDTRAVVSTGLLKFDLRQQEVVPWQPGPFRMPSEPLFVRAVDGHNDEEGWLLCLVDDLNRGATDLVVLDASTLGRRGPEAVIHLPVRLPLRAHGEWVPADRYR